MNYEYKYKEALKVIESLYNTVKYLSSSDALLTCQTIEKAFPELKESEDERIRKEIIQFLQLPHPQFVGKRNYEEWITWLEKQSEQKSVDMIEPKFKVGDWITNGEYTWKVTSIYPLDYILQSPNGNTVDDTISHVDEHFHLWTIQDAGDGDVLAYNDGSLTIFRYRLSGLDAGLYMSYVLLTDKIEFKQTCAISNVHPATKEQSDLLFQKMKETGYEWDFEKKELRTIEQKSTWSEEDLTCLGYLAKFVDENGDSFYGKNKQNVVKWIQSFANLNPTQKQEWSEEDKSMYIRTLGILGKCYMGELPTKVEEELEWLKSVELQSHWKPSEEQMKHLKSISVGWHPSLDDCRILSSLYNDLLKL